VDGDEGAKLIVTQYLAGELVEGSKHEWRPAIYRQAGELLALLHKQFAVEDADFEAREREKSLAALAKPHRIAPDVLKRLLDGWSPGPRRPSPWCRPTATGSRATGW